MGVLAVWDHFTSFNLSVTISAQGIDVPLGKESHMEGTLPSELIPIATRLAFEGVPVRVIARGFELPSELVRDSLRKAISMGSIIELPPEDWPPTARRADHLPANVAKETEKDMRILCGRVFKLTGLQSAFMLVLLKKDLADKDTLHHVIEQQRLTRVHRPDNPEETDPKMVDVVICLLRKRLKPFNITISTCWGDGYYLKAADRKKANDMIEALVQENAGNTRIG